MTNKQLAWYNDRLMEEAHIHSAQVFTWDYSHPFGSTDIRGAVIEGWPTNEDFDWMLDWKWELDGRDTETEGSFRTRLLAEAERYQLIRFNPNAALQRRIFADGFVPNSSEFAFETEYIAQRAEHMGTGEVRAYYVKKNDWGSVLHVSRN